MVNQVPSGRSRRTVSTRRAVLASIGAASTVGLAGCIGGGDGDGGDGNGGGGNGDTVEVGVVVPESNGREQEGAMLRDGYELAAEHVNAGTGPVTEDVWPNLGDGGLLGSDVEVIVEDSGGSGDGAGQAAQTLVDEGVAMLTGGASRAEGLAIQEVAANEEVVYMGGFVPTNAVGGESCSRFAFHEMYNPQIAVESLARTLADELGADSSVDFTQLYPDTPFGEEFSRAFKERLETVGPEWFGPVRDSTRTGRRSFEGPLQDILDGGPDLVILNYYGLDGVNAIRDFDSIAGDDVALAVPIIGPEMASEAGTALEGVYGTAHWLQGLPGGFSASFEESWDGSRSTEYPSQFAHLAYVQLGQYADAVAAAGGTDASGVIGELEGREYDVGTGTQLLRSCDHQSMRYAPVVRGKSQSRQSPGSYYEIVASLADGASDPPYPCEGRPAFACDL